MKFINTDHYAGDALWELRDGDNQPVEIGRIVESSRRHLNPEEDQRSFQLEGGTPALNVPAVVARSMAFG